MLDVNIDSLQIVHKITTKSIKIWKFSVCHENYPFEEVNDTNQFEASKLGGTIMWE